MRRFTDPEIVFHYEGTGGGMEKTLEANEGGTLTYDESPNYYAHLGGEKGKVERLSPAEEKARFPGYDEKIDSAVAYMKGRRGSASESN
ncbi:hypothetical protein SAMN06265365_1184 [Tistlia consotensis]|uniref:Uncharacterized protein n=1 Tax=Tistlia consotensis USBA 355 TaxID=560819 RepID=A0A1Y6CF72_9PROT|nr:hypothetical protein SAMN05428998_1195 [Tistlia consotensis USBA 355]SNR85187.1 hypothetical protein SAMN06265365_1184 [Tistlia consotensis]